MGPPEQEASQKRLSMDAGAVGGVQFRKYSLTPEKRKPASSAPAPENDGWQFIQEHGEMDKSDLKQLKWIHHHINLEGCPIHGWQECLVQKALDSLAKDSNSQAVPKI